MNYTLSPEYEELGLAVIDAVPELWMIRDAGIRIGFVSSFKEKKTGQKLVLGECIKLSELYSDLLHLDFLIVIYENNIVGLSENQKKILLWHELKHIGVEEKDGEPVYIVNPHDREEFDSIIRKVGLYWSDSGADVPDILMDASGGGPDGE